MTPAVFAMTAPAARPARFRACLDATPVALSRRERETLDLLAAGQAYKEIADALEIRLDTVRCYIRTLYRKLGAHSATQCLAHARHLGLL
jgi:DNA-binding NarL/FixJ family response regulator